MEEIKNVTIITEKQIYYMENEFDNEKIKRDMDEMIKTGYKFMASFRGYDERFGCFVYRYDYKMVRINGIKVR